MGLDMSRRSFVKAAGAAAVGAAALGYGERAMAGEFTGKIKKAVKFSMIGGDAPVAEKFAMLKEIGYDGVEMQMGNEVDPDEVAEASASTGLPIHGLVLGSSVGIGDAVDRAKQYGATSVLLVAGRVNEDMPYAQNYETTQAQIREAIPYAKEQDIMLLVENVWNNFLLSPVEMKRYIDEFESDQVGVYFDVGNVVRFGWPSHWIPVLGNRIHKLDIKAYSRTKQMNEGPWEGFKVEIGDDEVEWEQVRAELKKINYEGWATAEVGGGDRARLADIAARMNRVLDI
jgi:L-ribulose-5-phosphate 3-epimerase